MCILGMATDYMYVCLCLLACMTDSSKFAHALSFLLYSLMSGVTHQLLFLALCMSSACHKHYFHVNVVSGHGYQ